MNISASLLIKSSLTQLVYKTKKKESYKVTKQQKDGNNYAEQVSKGLAQEMRGSYVTDNYTIFFCIDALKENTGIEIKYIKDENNYPLWYLHSSILQSVFYATLIKKVNYLDTPKFRIKEGYEQVFYDLKDNPIDKFELWFGEHIKLQVERSNDVLKYYKDKADLLVQYSKLPWDEAMYLSKKYDIMHKFKDWSLLEKHIKYFTI